MKARSRSGDGKLQTEAAAHAANLGLSGVTQANEFLRLCENLHQQTEERLTQRQNTTRLKAGEGGKAHEVVNRRVFYDFTLSPPKSVSIAGLDAQGAIVSCTLADQNVKLTEHFLELFKTQQPVVVVSQSWSEIHKVNEKVRLALKAQKLLGETETAVTALERLDLTRSAIRNDSADESD